MFNLFKKKKKIHKFILIKNFHKKDFYFIRSAEWGFLDKDNLFIKDHHKSKLITPSPWGRNIFYSANGEMTVEEYVYYVATLYKDDIPVHLEQTIIFELLGLVESDLISLVPGKQRPLNEFDLPGLNPT